MRLATGDPQAKGEQLPVAARTDDPDVLAVQPQELGEVDRPTVWLGPAVMSAMGSHEGVELRTDLQDLALLGDLDPTLTGRTKLSTDADPAVAGETGQIFVERGRHAQHRVCRHECRNESKLFRVLEQRG